jgi:hypothetical protein
VERLPRWSDLEDRLPREGEDVQVAVAADRHVVGLEAAVAPPAHDDLVELRPRAEHGARRAVRRDGNDVLVRADVERPVRGEREGGQSDEPLRHGAVGAVREHADARPVADVDGSVRRDRERRLPSGDRDDCVQRSVRRAPEQLIPNRVRDEERSVRLDRERLRADEPGHGRVREARRQDPVRNPLPRGAGRRRPAELSVELADEARGQPRHAIAVRVTHEVICAAVPVDDLEVDAIPGDALDLHAHRLAGLLRHHRCEPFECAARRDAGEHHSSEQQPNEHRL